MTHKFRFIITNTYDGELQGTDEIKQAQKFAKNEDYFVYDSETGEWLQENGNRVAVVAAPVVDTQEDDEDDEDDE